MGIIPADLVIPLASMLGIGFLGMVAAFGQWWGKRAPTTAERTLEVAGALVDSESVKLLTAAIEAHTLEMVTGRHEAEKARAIGHKMVELVGGLTDELADVRRATADLANQVARKK
jgi:hypothetical protein